MSAQQKVSDPIEFHSPQAIAFLLTILLRNSNSASGDFGDFATQIRETATLAQKMVGKGVTGADQFQAIVTLVKGFYDAKAANRDKFDQAHNAIRDLLLALPDGDPWGPCKYVSHDTIEQIVSLQ